MAAGTKNYFVGPEDGWTQVLDGTSPAITFFRVQSYPECSPFYVHVGAAAPTAPQVGLIVLDDEFWFQGSEAQKVFVKVIKPGNVGTTGDKLRIDVYCQGGVLS